MEQELTLQKECDAYLYNIYVAEYILNEVMLRKVIFFGIPLVSISLVIKKFANAMKLGNLRYICIYIYLFIYCYLSFMF